ncbi:MAG: cytochrome P450 [bacterium]|nr:cytochrome P450 [bacterium]
MRIVEEILLLLIDTERGDIRASFSPRSRDIALSGAVLMDLALENRIDTDLEELALLDPTPLGDELLDPALSAIAQASGTHSTAYWIGRMAERGADLRDAAIDRLIGRGILEAESNGLVFLSRLVSRARRYPSDGPGRGAEDVQSRIMRQLFGDDVPDPRDIVIISLAAACGVFERILSREELADVEERIDLISRMELIGRTVAEAVNQVEAEATASPVARPFEEIPRASGLPLAGNMFAMRRDLRSLLLREYRKHGPIFRLQAFNHHFIALVGPEATTFLSREGKAHLRSFEEYSPFRESLGCVNMVAGMDGPDHVRMRKALATGYSRKYLNGRHDEIVDIAGRVVAGWPRGRAIEPIRMFQAIISEQLGMLMLGESSEQYVKFLRNYMKILVYLMRPGFGIVFAKTRIRRAEKQIFERFDRILQARMKEDRPDDARGDFVDEILAIHRNDPMLIPETDLRFNLLGPYLAGIDTAAVVCSFMLYVLLTNPPLLKEMRAEVDSVFESGPITAESFGKLAVTRRIFYETQRRYSIIPALGRIVSNSFEFGGHTVPAGKRVLVGCTVAHAMQEFYPEPEKFDIERWGEDRAERRQPGTYAPFGFGSHRCQGSSLVEVQIALTMATIVRETELELLRPRRPLKMRQTSAMQPIYKFRLVDRRGP